jgi:hypothetical protein
MVNNCVMCPASGMLGFFRFPKNPGKRKLWIKSCNLSPDFIPNLYSRICKLHFKSSDLSPGTRQRLSKGKPFFGVQCSQLMSCNAAIFFLKTCGFLHYTPRFHRKKFEKKFKKQFKNIFFPKSIFFVSAALCSQFRVSCRNLGPNDLYAMKSTLQNKKCFFSDALPQRLLCKPDLPTASATIEPDQSPIVTLDQIVTSQLANRGIIVTKCRKILFTYWHRGHSKVLNVRTLLTSLFLLF